MSKPPTPSASDLLSLIDELSSSDVYIPENLRKRLVNLAEAARSVGAEVDLSESLPDRDAEQLFLTRLELFLPNLPNKMTPRQISLVISFIVDSYGLDLPAVQELMKVTLAFLTSRIALKEQGAENGSTIH
jgi:hypothetical protein